MSILPAWLRPRTARVDELEQQLASAREALAAAQTATAAAQAAFDDEPTDGMLKMLGKARDLETAAAEHAGRAERLLDAARQREAAEQRARLEKRLGELEAALSTPALAERRSPTLSRLVDALEAALVAEGERAVVEEQVSALDQELLRVRVALGLPSEAGSTSADHPPSRLAVAERLEALLQKYPARDPRRELAHALVDAFGGAPLLHHYRPPAREAAE